MKTYKEIERELHEIGNGFGTKDSRREVKKMYGDPNVMTPEIVGIWKNRKGVYCEISFGVGIYNEWLFGLTFKDSEGNDLRDLSMCLNSTEAVRNHLESVRLGLNADPKKDLQWTKVK